MTPCRRGAPVPGSTGRQIGSRAIAAMTIAPATAALTMRNTLGCSRSVTTRGAADRSGATAATAASDHQAIPRTVYAPITKKNASQTSVAHGVTRPRRPRNATTSAADAKKSIPCTSRSVVGCHSLILRVTSGFALRPTAYVQTLGPNGVTQHRRTVTTPTSRARCRSSTRCSMSDSQARPRTAGARKKLPCTFAQAIAMNGTSQSLRGCSWRSTTSRSVNENNAIAMSWGRSASAGAATMNAPRASHAASRASRPRR